jgi:hypothetical protein
MRLEYDITSNGRLARKEGSTQNAQFVAYRFRQGAAYYFREDLASERVRALSTLSPSQALNDRQLVYEALGGPFNKRRVWRGVTYVFDSWPEGSSSAHVRKMEEDFVFLIENEPVSFASTVRCDNVAAEVRVHTISRYRRRGYGKAVACSWAQYQLLSDRVPFYSHLATNRPSRKLAVSLGVRRFSAVAAYD